jgi:hypothetical protein
MHEALGEEEYVAPFGVHMYTVHGCIKLLDSNLRFFKVLH